MAKTLFPDLPEDLAALSDDDIDSLEKEHRDAAELIRVEDEQFLEGMQADEVLGELERGVGQINKIKEYRASMADGVARYEDKKTDLLSAFAVDEDPGDETDAEEKAEEIVAETDTEDDGDDTDDGNGDEEESKVEERELVLASADTTEPEAVVKVRRPPAPAANREPVPEPETKEVALVASGEMGSQFKDPLNAMSLAELVIAAADHHGPHPKIDPAGKYRFGGPEHKIARAVEEYPEDRVLDSNLDSNTQKIEAVIAASIPGSPGQYSLTASGGLCAPLEPIYSMPNFATEDEPVWDSLPKFQARRGGVNVPAATYVGDITTAISSISEANDALGGTFATKSCQDLSCPAYTETAVQILAHCREYGNLNARAWPEKIRHENALTMAALARTSEDFMLEQIKALSVNVTNGVETLGALIYLVDAIVKSAFGIRGRLRMPANARFRALLPSYALDLLVLDTIQTPFDRFRSKQQINEYLRSVGIDPVYYIDGNFAAGDDQLPDASQTAAAIDGFPNTVQWAIFPEGAFMGIDSGTLELGIVRDSTLNSTNDFQVFGERFRNVVRLAPAQAAYWVTTDWCPVGTFPPAGTARTCE